MISYRKFRTNNVYSHQILFMYIMMTLVLQSGFS